MGIGILLIIFSIFNILLLISGIGFIFTSYYYYSIAIFVLVMIVHLFISIIFFKYTNQILEKEKHILKSFKLTKCIHKENEINIIEFKLNNNKWVSNKDESLSFTIDNYLFRKSFIIARIIRELRYPIVSNQLNLSQLLNLKLKIDNIDNLIVRFDYGNDVKEYILVKEYISKNTMLSRAISKSRYYDLYLSNRSYYKYMKKIEKINENIYLN